MGSFCCKESEDDDPHDYASERQRLLPETVQPIYVQPAGVTRGPQGDLHSIMEDIVKTVEGQIVDAGAADVSILEHPEYMERARYYTTRIREYGSNFDPGQFLPRAQGNPVIILSGPTLPFSELQMIKTQSKSNFDHVEDFALEEKEDLVVQFHEP